MLLAMESPRTLFFTYEWKTGNLEGRFKKLFNLNHFFKILNDFNDNWANYAKFYLEESFLYLSFYLFFINFYIMHVFLY